MAKASTKRYQLLVSDYLFCFYLDLLLNRVCTSHQMWYLERIDCVQNNTDKTHVLLQHQCIVFIYNQFMNQFLSQGMGCIRRQAFSDSTTRGNKTATAHKFQNTLESEVNRLIIICSAEKSIQYTCLVIKLLQTCS